MPVFLDALQHINFVAVAVLELAGLITFLGWGKHLRVRCDLLWLLIGIAVWCLAWRVSAGLQIRRYYLATLLPALPFALVPLTIEWSSLPWSRRWRRLAAGLIRLLYLGVIVISVGKSLRPELRTPAVGEFSLLLKSGIAGLPAGSRPVLLDNTTRGEQILLRSGGKMARLWVPSYKEEPQCGRASDHLAGYLEPSGSLAPYSELFCCYRTEQPEVVAAQLEAFCRSSGWSMVRLVYFPPGEPYLFFHLRKEP